MEPNIVWITIESGRFDSTSLYSKKGPLNSILDRGNARSFKNCHSHGIWTLTSSASILTGTYPSYHRTGGTINDILPRTIPTVPELLGNTGYKTICLAANPHLGESSGLDRGFDKIVRFGQDHILNDVPYKTILKYILNLNKYGGGITTNTLKHTTSYMMTDVAKQLLSNSNNEHPIFLYGHYGDPHHPYIPPKSYFDQVVNNSRFTKEEAFEILVDHTNNHLEYMANDCNIPNEKLKLLKESHKHTVKSVEDQLEKLYNYIQSLERETILVITGDHGELFGEDNLLGHRLSTHSVASHVPMLVDGPTDIVNHTSERVQPIDVMTTILKEQGANISSLQGKILSKETRENSIIKLFGERNRSGINGMQAHNSNLDSSSFHKKDVTILRTDDFKYKWTDGDGYLFEAPDDSTEVSGQYPSRAEKFRECVAEFFVTEGDPHSSTKSTTSLDKATKKRLEQMGYLTSN